MSAGDHISVPGESYQVKGAGPFHRHHMIVKEVRGKDKLLVIHYYAKADKDTAAIVEQEYTTDPKDIHLIEYDPKAGHIYNGEEAIARAETRCDTGKGEYSLIFNNCEHFCTSVKTDKKESLQVQRAVKVTSAVAAGLFAVGAGAGAAYQYIFSKPTESKEPTESSTSKSSDSQGEQ